MIKKTLLFLLLTIFSHAENMDSTCKNSFQQLKEQADQGDPSKMYIIGLLYQHGICVEKNLSEAQTWFIGAFVKDFAPAQYTLGDLFYNQKDDKTAAKVYEAFFANPHKEIRTRLGNIYLNGVNVDENITKAKNLYMIAAEADFTPAINNLGMLYFHGLGVEQNLNEAKKYLHKAAINNHKKSQFYLAMALSIDATPKDKKESLEWLKTSAENGYDQAQAILGEAYFLGEDIEKDTAKAKYWIEKAKNQQNPKAIELWEKYKLEVY